MGLSEVSTITGLTVDTVRYWARKQADPTFRSGGHGGARNFSMTTSQHTLSEAVLLSILNKYPDCTLDGLALKMKQYGCRDANRAWVVRRLSEWHFTHKRLYYVQIQKFTELNVLRYIDHIFAIPRLDPRHLKYLDESRFETKSKLPKQPHMYINICCRVYLHIPSRT